MGKIIRNTLILTIIIVVAGLGLGPVYEVTKSPLKFYILDENGNPTKRYKDSGESELVYDQERVLAFDYCSIAKNYDLSLQLLTEKR